MRLKKDQSTSDSPMLDPLCAGHRALLAGGDENKLNPIATIAIGEHMRDMAFHGSLDRNALLAQARAETGLADFGDEDEPAFGVTLDRFAATMAASELGAPHKVAAYGQLVNVLAWRVRLGARPQRAPGGPHRAL